MPSTHRAIPERAFFRLLRQHLFLRDGLFNLILQGPLVSLSIGVAFRIWFAGHFLRVLGLRLILLRHCQARSSACACVAFASRNFRLVLGYLRRLLRFRSLFMGGTSFFCRPGPKLILRFIMVLQITGHHPIRQPSRDGAGVHLGTSSVRPVITRDASHNWSQPHA